MLGFTVLEPNAGVAQPIGRLDRAAPPESRQEDDGTDERDAFFKRRTAFVSPIATIGERRPFGPRGECTRR